MKTSWWQSPARRLIYVALGTLAYAGSLSAQPESTSLTLTVVEGHPYSDALVEGDATGTMAALQTKADAGSDYALSNNLCVALISAGTYKRASEHCMNAVREARSNYATSTNSTFHLAEEQQQFRNQLAIALSNQGVLLAMTGDGTQARLALQQAAELRTDFNFPAANLAYIERKGGEEPVAQIR